MISAAIREEPPRDTGLYWSAELEELHEESSRTSFIDVWTRAAMIEHLGELIAGRRIVDLGCSSGYLLEDLAGREAGLYLVGVDYVTTLNVPLLFSWSSATDSVGSSINYTLRLGLDTGFTSMIRTIRVSPVPVTRSQAYPRVRFMGH